MYTIGYSFPLVHTHTYTHPQHTETDRNPFQQYSAFLSTSASSVPPFVRPAQLFPFIVRAQMEQSEAREGKERKGNVYIKLACTD